MFSGFPGIKNIWYHRFKEASWEVGQVYKLSDIYEKNSK
jgi:hypothetical protein